MEKNRVKERETERIKQTMERKRCLAKERTRQNLKKEEMKWRKAIYQIKSSKQ